MKKFFLGLFIFADLGLIGGSVFVLYTYVSHRKARFPLPASGSVPAASTATGAPGLLAVSSATVAGGVTASTASSFGQTTRTKVFSYRNSRAKHVAIRADFTGWKAEAMQRDAAGVWTYRAVLSPGEYAYCYSVDNKPPLKDPVNKRTKTIGRAVVSAIVVEPFPPAPAK